MIDPRHALAIRRRGPWRSFQALEQAALKRAHGFNNPRLLEPIGNNLERVALNLIQIECNPRQASRW